VRSGLKGFNILVADDERYITATISLKLRQAGANVIVASDGVEAFELARVHRPNLICSGYQMPLMNGLQLAEKLRNTLETAHIPVLMLTSRSHRITPTQLIDSNIRAILGKPFSTRELLAKLQEVAFEMGIAA
jgi:DNA-binding response OmpR family regulator